MTAGDSWRKVTGLLPFRVTLLYFFYFILRENYDLKYLGFSIFLMQYYFSEFCFFFKIRI